ncbi:MAG: GAF domain-containing protein [Dehalococcoidia bacterium]
MVDSPNLPAGGGSLSHDADLELRLRRAEVLAALGTRVRFDRPLPEVLRSLAVNIVENTDAVAAGLILMNPADLSAIAFGTENLPDGYVEAMVRARQRSPAATAELRAAVARQESWTLHNAIEFMLSRPEYAGMHDLIRGLPYSTLVATPFLNRPETLGVVYLYYAGSDVVDEGEVTFAQAIAQHAAPIMDNAWLLAEANRRSDELDALSRADQALHESLRLDDVYQSMINLAVDLFGTDRSMFLTFDEAGRLHAFAARGVPEDELAQLQEIYHRRDRSYFKGITEAPHIMEDVPNDQTISPEIKTLTPSASTVDIRVFVGGEFFGVFVLGYHKRRTFGDDDRRLFSTLATRAGLAIQNALLFEEAQRRTDELEALYRADYALHQTLSLDGVLDAMTTLAVDLLGADSSLVVSWQEDDRLGVASSFGIPEEVLGPVAARYRTFTHEHFASLGPPFRAALVGDIRETTQLPPELRDGRPGSFAEIPVMVGGELWGLFAIGWNRSRTFNDGDRRLFDAFAARAGLAIQNALLFEQAQHSASMEERQRIARELHDSVSQALYGIGLGARTARRRLGDGAASDVLEPIEYIVQLAESGLAETRALIFELVPESLEQQGLVLALERQAAAIRSRFRIDVSAILCDEPALALRSKEALYRIAQESLHNIAKHAEATEVTLSLATDGSNVTLFVRDNGKGFDVDGDFPGHLGLRTMRERTERIGGRYEIVSELGAGTLVTVTVPLLE